MSSKVKLAKMTTKSAVAAYLLMLAGFSYAGDYGAEMPGGATAKPLGEALSSLVSGGSVTGKFAGNISQVCQKKGCFMILADGTICACDV